MLKAIPHPVPYQGSKRHLAEVICSVFPSHVETLYEPFAGSAAVTLYAAYHRLAERFVIGDTLPALVELWEYIINHPETTALRYEHVWLGHIGEGHSYFNSVRDRFNQKGDPIDLLYLIARCVKNAVRFNRSGQFTQSVDKRRLGMHPNKMKKAIHGASFLLKGRVELVCADFQETVSNASERDLIYMDPPYQGTTYGRDKRYFAQVERHTLVNVLRNLNERNIPILLSYDGLTGAVVHGEPLPDDLELCRFFLNAGRSSQATLNGRQSVTIESLYASSLLVDKILTTKNALDKRLLEVL